jgi:hypothetical protein
MVRPPRALTLRRVLGRGTLKPGFETSEVAFFGDNEISKNLSLKRILPHQNGSPGGSHREVPAPRCRIVAVAGSLRVPRMEDRDECGAAYMFRKKQTVCQGIVQRPKSSISP